MRLNRSVGATFSVAGAPAPGIGSAGAVALFPSECGGRFARRRDGARRGVGRHILILHHAILHEVIHHIAPAGVVERRAYTASFHGSGS